MTTSQMMTSPTTTSVRTIPTSFSRKREKIAIGSARKALVATKNTKRKSFRNIAPTRVGSATSPTTTSQMTTSQMMTNPTTTSQMTTSQMTTSPTMMSVRTIQTFVSTTTRQKTATGSTKIPRAVATYPGKEKRCPITVP